MDKDMIEFLKSIGAIEELPGGNYRLSEEAEEFVPEVVKHHEAMFNNDVFSLWINDMIDLVFDDDGDPMLDITETSRDEVRQYECLTPQEINTLRMIIQQYDTTLDKNQALLYNIHMSDELDPPDENHQRVTVAMVEGKAYWVHDNAMWETEVDENGEPDRAAARPIDTEDMSFQQIKMHMAILDSITRESNG